MFDTLPIGLVWVVVLLWGAIWGSFANVVIARVPYAQSIAFPASHCPRCKTPIRWFDNLPILSWFLLRGRCRACDVKISSRYPLVEFGGVLCSLAAAYIAMGGFEAWRLTEAPALEVVGAWMLLSFFFLSLLVLVMIDLEHLLLPHRITIVLVLLAFVYAVVVPPGGAWRGVVPSPSLMSAGIGFIVAYGGLFSFAMSFQLITGRQGIGGGDFMLFGALGAWFGWEALPMLMLLAAFQGVLGYVLAQRFFPSLIREAGDEAFWDGTTADLASELAEARTEEEAPATTASPEEAAPSGGRGVPFGPFLCLSAVEFIVVGPLYLRWLNGGI